VNTITVLARMARTRASIAAARSNKRHDGVRDEHGRAETRGQERLVLSQRDVEVDADADPELDDEQHRRARIG
jgi:hypothetical protein